MITLMATLALLAGAQNAAPAVASAVLEPRQIAENAMKFVAVNDMKGLFELIARHMPLAPEELEKIRVNMVEQRKAIPGSLGKSLGYAFISECRKSDFLVRYVFVEKREKNVMRWQFIFYKPRTTWHMSHFYWDQDTNSLFAPCN
jgi:hypothetical protein